MEATLLTIINALILIAIGAGGFIIKNLSNRLSEVEKEQRGMKTNYLDRFAEAKQHTTDEIAKVITAINDLKVEIAKIKN